MPIFYDPHAVFQITRRSIPGEWIEQTLLEPDIVEDRMDGKTSFLKCFHKKMLRVVTRKDDHHYVITAYFDRRQPCE